MKKEAGKHMSAQFALLGLLEPAPNYGYELKKSYDRLFSRDKPILSGQVYSTLGRLQRDGKVHKYENQNGDSSGGPERVKYEITDFGRQSLKEWLETPEEPAPQLQTALFVKTILALIRGDETTTYLDNQRHAHIERMRALTRQRRESSLTEKLLIDHAIFHLEADLRWMDLARSRLTKLKEDLNL
jgi:DNA-binding PadR family transcriptional regulator